MAAKSRQSNFELLRIIAMFMVLMLHAGYAAFGWPKYHQVLAQPDVLSMRILIEQLAIPAVDIFVLISGWFGIRATARGVAKLFFQVGFVSACAVAVAYLYRGSFTADTLTIIKGLFEYWFIWSYLILFLVSPILNAYLKNATKRQLERWMLLFFGLAALNLVFKYTKDFNLGYSAIFFIGLYILGYYLRHHLSPVLRLSNAKLWGIFLLATAFPVAMQILSAYVYPIPVFGAFVEINTAYCNPIVVLQAASLILIFGRYQFQSRAINWIAASAFSVYIFHQNGQLIGIFFDNVREIAEQPRWLVLPLEFMFLCCVFMLSIFVDKARIFVWGLVEQRLPKKAAAILILPFLFSCSGSTDSAETSEDSAKTAQHQVCTIALLSTADCQPFFYAQEHGMYKRLGLDIAFERYESQYDCDTALAGHADGAYADSLFLSKSARFQKSRVAMRTRTSCGVVSAASLRFRAAKELEGRVIAIAPQTLSEQIAYEGVRSGGVATTEVMYPHIGSFAVATGMLRDSQIDAAVLPEPFLTEAVQHRAKALYRKDEGWRGAVVVNGSNARHKLTQQQIQTLRKGYNMAVDSLNKQTKTHAGFKYYQNTD